MKEKFKLANVKFPIFKNTVQSLTPKKIKERVLSVFSPSKITKQESFVCIIDKTKLESLHLAVYFNDFLAINKIINLNVNKLDKVHQCTALHIAAEFNSIKILAGIFNMSKYTVPGTSKTFNNIIRLKLIFQY